MGRTLHFTVTPDKPFTDSQINKMYEITLHYNSGKFKDVWSCENFWLDPYSYYPKWDNPLINKYRDKAWEIVGKRYSEIFAKNRDHAKTCRELKKAGYISFRNDNPKKQARAFCKVQGNEYNSLLVILALIDISKAIPKADITVSDEGRFLLCNLIIRNGKALPDLHDIKEDIFRYAGMTLLSKPHFLRKLKELKGLDKDIAQDLKFGNNYGESMLKYLDEKLHDLKIVLERIRPIFMKNNKRNPYFCIHNIMNPPGYDPLLLTRTDQLNITRFAKYEMTPDTMMDGFNGEGFGLANPEDAIRIGQNMTALVKSIIGDNKDVDVKILGE